jgi:hypothetical protein
LSWEFLVHGADDAHQIGAVILMVLVIMSTLG